MPTLQTIPNIENRDFPTSIGDWTGDATWQDGPVLVPWGIAVLTLLPGETQKTMSLAYPNILPRRGKQHQLSFSCFKELKTFTITFTYELSDGVYSFTGFLTIPDPLIAGSISDIIDIPANFDTPNALLEIAATIDPQADEIHACTNFYSLTYDIPAAQHFTFLGIG